MDFNPGETAILPSAMVSILPPAHPILSSSEMKHRIIGEQGPPNPGAKDLTERLLKERAMSPKMRLYLLLIIMIIHQKYKQCWSCLASRKHPKRYLPQRAVNCSPQNAQAPALHVTECSELPDSKFACQPNLPTQRHSVAVLFTKMMSLKK